MKNALPLCCSPEAFNLLARQVAAVESPDALVHGATAIAMHQLDNVTLQDVDATLQRYADVVREVSDFLAERMASSIAGKNSSPFCRTSMALPSTGKGPAMARAEPKNSASFTAKVCSR